jgi:undecaprenyl diphosphate synthase
MTLPRHIAIIMDGNGRWANKRGLPRVAGHKVGVESIRTAIEFCSAKKIEVLTLFAFSTENWERPKEEVGYLLGQLLVQALESEINGLHKNGVQFRVIGERERLDKKLQQKIIEAERLTANNDGLKLVIALSYSGRWDITQALCKICSDVEAGKVKASSVTAETIQKRISLHDLPEPDLLIRTSGEQRISNFMLWQLAYTELYFTDVLWPDFREEAFAEALHAYEVRSRRFGKC